jgi:hypothetical protein
MWYKDLSSHYFAIKDIDGKWNTISFSNGCLVTIFATALVMKDPAILLQ